MLKTQTPNVDAQTKRTLRLGLDSAFAFYVCVFSSFFFFLGADFVDFSTINSASVHCSWTHKQHFSIIFSLKMGPTVLFTHLKIILLHYFQFSVFSFSKISSIQTDPQLTLVDLACYLPHLIYDLTYSQQHLSLLPLHSQLTLQYRSVMAETSIDAITSQAAKLNWLKSKVNLEVV